jgi:hypothetical protein
MWNLWKLIFKDSIPSPDSIKIIMHRSPDDECVDVNSRIVPGERCLSIIDR